jgi:chromosome segregation ATPase
MSNLLDFDIPPAPTPRSMPTITPRELESLKSSFLSEISSLKASLSGKEAEVQSLKTAVGDAEKRVGESLEQVREERNLKELLAAEKEEWDKRGREMEAVLRNVREEIVHGERERDELEGRLDESERRREAAEMMAQEAESKMAAMKAGKVSPISETSEAKSGECHCGGRAVELAVEKVSRELHSLYKDKHETKVSALKKSYEKRWDKKVKDLETQVEDLSKENEEL